VCAWRGTAGIEGTRVWRRPGGPTCLRPSDLGRGERGKLGRWGEGVDCAATRVKMKLREGLNALGYAAATEDTMVGSSGGTEWDTFLTVDTPLLRHKDLAEGREVNENERGKRTEDCSGRCRGRVGTPRRTPRTGRKK
jgi:hypothetical protein